MGKFEKANIKNERDLIISAADTNHSQAVMYISGKEAHRQRLKITPSKRVKNYIDNALKDIRIMEGFR